ncbi:hypothetical protein HELRODRAFT_169427 [Helobdella robusta]|uniref:ETS domain-containing protein n=1 Tax=Helobdella robusta TaxID=6412 RepID=T1F1X1_HELRO|nr:hypothetical protein HELRODRAFT_169427 [Helobdella robusta]ESO08553.1 hypothetical protein HELRODRAFT_169427 [Helobdella robusta]
MFAKSGATDKVTSLKQKCKVEADLDKNSALFNHDNSINNCNPLYSCKTKVQRNTDNSNLQKSPNADINYDKLDPTYSQQLLNNIQFEFYYNFNDYNTVNKMNMVNMKNNSYTYFNNNISSNNDPNLFTDLIFNDNPNQRQNLVDSSKTPSNEEKIKSGATDEMNNDNNNNSRHNNSNYNKNFNNYSIYYNYNYFNDDDHNNLTIDSNNSIDAECNNSKKRHYHSDTIDNNIGSSHKSRRTANGDIYNNSNHSEMSDPPKHSVHNRIRYILNHLGKQKLCCGQLWKFLIDLLADPQKADGSIEWVGLDGKFKMLDSEKVARKYYYKNILDKVLGEKFTYQFNLAHILRQGKKPLQDCFKRYQQEYKLAGNISNSKKYSRNESDVKRAIYHWANLAFVFCCMPCLISSSDQHESTSGI